MNTIGTLEYLDKKSKLSFLWVFVFLNMIFRDLHELGRLGFIEEIMTGVVNGVRITEELMLFGGLMIAVPLLMVPLIQFLNVKANRVTNLVIASVSIMLVIVNNLAPDLDDVLFASIELVALLLIAFLAWGLIAARK